MNRKWCVVEKVPLIFGGGGPLQEGRCDVPGGCNGMISRYVCMYLSKFLFLYYILKLINIC